MKKHLLLFASAFICFNFGFEANLNAHGFAKNTLIKKIHGWKKIRQVHDDLLSKNKQILSYDFTTGQCVRQSIKNTGISTSNCYFRIGFNESYEDNIICTPTQEFYLAESKKWTPAYNLKEGDILLSKCNKLTPINFIEFVPEEIKVYVLEIEKTHTFFVGRSSVITHNMALPALSASIIIPFGTCTASGMAGGFLGPIGFVGGIAIGSIIGIAIKTCIGPKMIPYKLSFDIQHIDTLFHTNETNEAATKKIDEVLSNATPGRKTSGKATQFEKPGDFGDALNDFEKLGVINVKEIKNGKIGELSNGKTVNVRSESSAKTPTLEIYNPENKKSIKIRYTAEEV